MTPRQQINLFHILAVAPLLVYVGYNRGNVDPRVYNVLLALGVVVALYHFNLYQQ